MNAMYVCVCCFFYLSSSKMHSDTKIKRNPNIKTTNSTQLINSLDNCKLLYGYGNEILPIEDKLMLMDINEIGLLKRRYAWLQMN